MSAATSPESFQVMHEVDGDECLLSMHSTLAEALTVALQETATDNRASISIWSPTRGIIALPGSHGGWIATRAATPGERSAVEFATIWQKITRGEKLTYAEETAWKNRANTDHPVRS